VSAFSSLDLFYRGDPRRRRSPELDFGVWWSWEGERFRVSWLDSTGELIVVRLGHGPRERMIRIQTHLDGIEALMDGERLEVYVLAAIAERSEVEALLDGWADVVERPESLGWVVARCRGRAESLLERARPRVRAPEYRR
jgi:hypothetical protein